MPDRAPSSTDAESLLLAAEEAEAEAVAAEARARAARLRRQARTAGSDDSGETTEAESTEAGSTGTGGRRRTLAAVAASAVICTAVVACAYMLRHHAGASDRDRRAAEFEAAARQGVVTLTTLDFDNADADVQRVLDNSTGEFHDDFRNRAQDFVDVIEQSNVATEGTVDAAAVESMTDDSAVVLVAATSKVTNAAGADQEPRVWRLSVTVTRDGDRLKMSKVEFVP
ncbi:hypothetical protein M1M07_14900 [Rhodococcus sp. HM1]|uniref:hypothetical protein n=1 Tax=unclassified Rhodococcus (in: high G+C Gram-positive bacteria) TaxID=192944 RepID=UPI0018CE846F|nr:MULTISPECIES: hypothetical protein [unclassified Rhodococcus (in: high G+C Gram-positive bacteria)]MBH0122004.1 hypothetical protein [Rhodococcus sp. CX]MCK8672392.1 hypothetical protein [Rhodococcus sp. HM1]